MSPSHGAETYVTAGWHRGCARAVRFTHSERTGECLRHEFLTDVAIATPPTAARHFPFLPGGMRIPGPGGQYAYDNGRIHRRTGRLRQRMDSRTGAGFAA